MVNESRPCARRVNPDFLGLAATDPQLLTLRGLAAYIDHLRRNNLETASYEIGYWSRIARLFAVIIVTLLALPFVFGPLRTTGAGTRTVIGVHAGRRVFSHHAHHRERRAALRRQSGAGGLAADRGDRLVHVDRDLKNPLDTCRGDPAYDRDSTRVFDSRSCTARCSGSRYSHSTPSAAGAHASIPHKQRSIAAASVSGLPESRDRAQVPGAHSQGLAAAHPIEHVVACDHHEQARARYRYNHAPAVSCIDSAAPCVKISAIAV